MTGVRSSDHSSVIRAHYLQLAAPCSFTAAKQCTRRYPPPPLRQLRAIILAPLHLVRPRLLLRPLLLLLLLLLAHPPLLPPTLGL